MSEGVRTLFGRDFFWIMFALTEFIGEMTSNGSEALVGWTTSLSGGFGLGEGITLGNGSTNFGEEASTKAERLLREPNSPWLHCQNHP